MPLKSFNKFSLPPFLFLVVCMCKNPGHLTQRVYHNLSCADCIVMLQLNMFFCPLYFWKIDSWIQRLDQTQVHSLWQDQQFSNILISGFLYFLKFLKTPSQNLLFM